MVLPHGTNPKKTSPTKTNPRSIHGMTRVGVGDMCVYRNEGKCHEVHPENFSELDPGWLFKHNPQRGGEKEKDLKGIHPKVGPKPIQMELYPFSHNSKALLRDFGGQITIP